MLNEILKRCFQLSILVIAINSFGQISFEQGYFIDDFGKETKCYIKNIDWKNNPVEFLFKLSIDDSIKQASIDTIQEFGINIYTKYKRHLVKLDKSSNKITELSYNKNAKYNTELVFLKTLVEGKANLYSYTENDINSFFYQIDDTTDVEQLIYKHYKIDETKIGVNNYYKQQIINFNGNCLNNNYITNLSYTKKDLIECFKRYNSCLNSSFVIFEDQRNKDLFNLNIKPGIRYSSLKMGNLISSYKNVDYGFNLGASIGIEAENILPFNRNKWGIGLEPVFQFFNAEDPTKSYSKYNYVDYKSIEISAFVRYYLFLTNKSKASLHGGCVIWDFPLNSKIGYTKINSGINPFIGVGYKFDDLLSIELRYSFSRELLNNYITYYSEYRSISLSLGYSLF